MQWCYWPGGYELARRIGLTEPIVFDADNDILNCPTLAPERARIQSMLTDCAQHAVAVVAGSKQFLLRSRNLGFKRPTFLRNGVDLERFRGKHAEPEDLKRIPRPRLGYVGTLSKWVDYECLLNLARANPAWNIVIIGEPYLVEIPESFKTLPNVHLLGPRKAWEVPAYLAHFDVGLVPYRQADGSTADGDSMKMFEYLAAGLPVVAADFNGRLAEDFEGLVEIAQGGPRFSEAIERVLRQRQEDREEWTARRRSFLQKNTWACRAGEAVALMQGLDL